MTNSDILVTLEAIKQHFANDDIFYLGTALVKEGLSGNTWAQWRRSYPPGDPIHEMIHKIELAFESRLFEGSLRGKCNATVSIFALKALFGWSDKREAESQSASRATQLEIPYILVSENERVLL